MDEKKIEALIKEGKTDEEIIEIMSEETIEAFDLEQWENENPKNNPNLNQVLGTDEELFNHAFVQLSLLKEGAVIIIVESYDRPLGSKDKENVYSLLNSKEEEILEQFPGTNYLEIEIL